MAGTVDPRRWFVLAVLCLSTLVLVVDNMALNVAVPALTTDLGASAQDVQWILDSYILVFAGLLLTAGSLSDRFGRRRVLVIGLVLFGAGSLFGALASTSVLLIAARVGMGVGGALMMPSMLSILITVFDEEERRKAMAVWSAVATLGLIGGPILGGLLVDWFWWGAVFLVNVPIVVVSIVAALAWMPESRGPWRKPDPLGAVLSVVGLTALIWMIIELPKNGLAHPGTLAALAVAVVGLGGFVVWEARVESPMVPLGLFRNRNFSGGSLSLTLVQIGNGGLLLVVTQYLQFVLDYTPMQAGLALIPMAVASLLCNGFAATLGAKTGNRVLAVIGLVVVAGGFGVLTTLEPGAGFLPLGIAVALLGAGGGLAMPAAVSALMGAVPHEHAGVGSALNDTIQQAGAALGVAILGSVLSGAYSAAMPESAPEGAHRSIQDAFAVAAATGDAGLVSTARDAFTTAMSVSFVAAAVGALAGAVLSLVMIRDRKREAVAEEELAGVA
ncbi:MFS transporter [Saccharothrix variisporea]|uniref:EmrB/QacA subfamily drug resistance transporter n=1 Tax=Saccharothrix variisporea TaxID=543527 RepID=A0A495XHS8_9PSEU|nr:MFS transporter [Saccharothrix variisporea]RKT72645.1 EmrB/QacA subfamily drug resistance transporter [Saccharothrix variisporea]